MLSEQCVIQDAIGSLGIVKGDESRDEGATPVISMGPLCSMQAMVYNDKTNLDVVSSRDAARSSIDNIT